MKRIGLVILAIIVIAATTTQVGVRRAEAVAGSVAGIVELRAGGVTGPFAGVTMTLTAGATPGGGVVASTDTIADGSYSLTVEEGTYTLTAEPPDASGLTPTVRTVTVTAAGTAAENFLFTIVETKLTVSGTITGPAGPIVGASVTFTGPEAADGGTDTTDGSGVYSIEVLPRAYTVSVDMSTIAPFPDRYALRATGVPITANTLLDIQIPGSTVTINVVDDTTGDPITALVSAESRQPGPTVLGQPSTLNSVLNATSVVGSIDVLLAPGGTASASAAAAGYFTAAESFELPATSAVTLRLVPEPDPDQARITGRLLGPDSTPVVGAPVIVNSPDPQPPTDSNGRFDVLADAPIGGGNSRVELRNPSTASSTPSLPPLWSIRSNEVPHPEGGQTDIGDVVVAAEPVTIDVVDPDGVPVPAAYFDASDIPFFPTVPAPFGPYAGEARSRYDSNVTSDSSGVMLLRLFDNSAATGPFSRYQMTFAPPRGVDTCDFSAYNLVATDWVFDVTGPTTVTVRMNADADDPRCDGGPSVPETTVNGTILLAGTALERTFLGFLTPDPGGGVVRVGSETDASGDFTADLVDGDHRMDIFWTLDTDVWPELRLLSDDPVVTIDSVANAGPIDLGTFDVPLENLRVTVLTPDGRPIPGVKVSTPVFPTVSFQMNGFDFTGTSRFPGSPSTDGNGEATLPLFQGTYDLVFTPASGFVPFTLRNVALPAGGAGVQVQLAYPHSPPTAVITPSGTSTGVDTFEGTVSVSVTPEAFAGFGVQSVMVSVDGGTPFEYADPFPVSALGDHTIVVQVTDDGSVTGPPVSRGFRIVASSTPPSDPTVTPTQPTVTTSDPTVTPTQPAVTPAASDQTPGVNVPSLPTIPTIPAGPTSPTVASPTGAPLPSAPPAAPAGGLPATGTDVDMALAALLSLVAGALLVAITRRPRSA